MNILVCVKRVPATAGKITLTADEQAIDTRYLGFTVSPHEECAVEEAVRIVEAQGGGEHGPDPRPGGGDRPAARGDGGRHRSRHPARRPTAVSGMPSRPPRPSSTRSARARQSTARSTSSCSATRPPTPAITRWACGSPSRSTGRSSRASRALEVRDDTIVARREAAGGGWEVYEIPRPAVVTVKEGINLPRYPSVPGRLRARKKEIEQIELDRGEPRRRPGSGCACRSSRRAPSRSWARARRPRRASSRCCGASG